MGKGKYQIVETKVCPASYRNILGEERKDEIRDQIMQIIVSEKKYRDKDYSAKKLASDIGTNCRYISAVMADRFHTNYNGLVNMYRINEAMTLLADDRYRSNSIEEIGEMVGFGTRQAFYASFFRFQSITPREYRIKNLRPLKRKRRAKKEEE